METRVLATRWGGYLAPRPSWGDRRCSGDASDHRTRVVPAMDHEGLIGRDSWRRDPCGAIAGAARDPQRDLLEADAIV